MIHAFMYEQSTFVTALLHIYGGIENLQARE